MSDDTSLAEARDRLTAAEPAEIIGWALETYGPQTAIAFSGAEDVVLIHMAAASGLPFSAFCLDTGRLHGETLAFVDAVSERYGVDIERVKPDGGELGAFVTQKGLFSFLEDGHSECCGIRKVAPLRRTLAGRPAWITGQRRDQSPDTRGAVEVAEDDTGFGLVKVNPLAHWSGDQVWDYLRSEGVPTNPLHDAGFRSIGCEPCTRPISPGQHEREGRWWWEATEKKECGLHLSAEPEPGWGGLTED
jgi:phosphoadenosine phosphosulfate reductase